MRPWPDAPRSSSATACPRSRSPMRSWCSTADASIAHGDHAQLLESSELYREIVAKGLPDQVFLTRKPHERAGERTVSPAVGRGPGGGGGFGRNQWAGERASKGTRGRNLRGLLGLLRPYRARAAATLVALLVGTAATLAPPLLVKVAIDQGITKHDSKVLVLVVIAFLFSALLVWAMTYVQTYLVGWVGQRALADLRIRIFTHLQSLPIGFYESRPAGVLISRMTNDVEALDSLVTDSVVTLFQSGLTLLGTIVILIILDPKLALITFGIFPFVARGLDLVPAGLRRRVPAHARDDRLDHRLPAGDPLGHPRRAQLRPGALPRGALRRAQRGQPRGQHGHRAPQRGLLPRRGNALRRRRRGDHPLRRAAGDRRPRHRRHRRRVRRRARRTCSNRSSSSPSSTPPTSRAWRRSRRSSSCWMSAPTSRTAPSAIDLPRIDGEVSFEDISFAYAPTRGRSTPSVNGSAANGVRCRRRVRRRERVRKRPREQNALALDHVSLHIPPGRDRRAGGRHRSGQVDHGKAPRPLL